MVVPTSNRADYLDVTLASLAAQDADFEWETIVVDDGSTDSTPAVIERYGVRSLRHETPKGPNAGRNAATRASEADLIALIDDDIEAPPGWLKALVDRCTATRRRAGGRRTDPRPLRRPGAARVRARGPADHDARPRRRGRRGALRLEREHGLPARGVRARRRVPRGHPAGRRRGGLAAHAQGEGRQGRLHRRRLARAPPRRRRRAAAIADAVGLLPRAQPARVRRAPRGGAAGAARAACARGLWLAYGAPALPSGAHHGRSFLGSFAAWASGAPVRSPRSAVRRVRSGGGRGQ